MDRPASEARGRSDGQPCERSPSLRNDSTDARLITGLKNGDAESYRQFLEEYQRRMFSVAYRFLGDQEEARDCVQDVCISIVKNIDRFEWRSALSTWVHRIVTTNALTRLRRRRTRAETNLEDHVPKYDQDGYLIWPADHVVQSLDRLLEREQIASEVRNAIDALPGDHRAVVLLRDMEGYSTEETAEVLGITPGAAKVRLHRARSALKGLLKPVVLRSDQ